MSCKYLIFLVHDFSQSQFHLPGDCNQTMHWEYQTNILPLATANFFCNFGKVEFQSKKQLLQDVNIVRCWLLPSWRADCTVQNVQNLNYKSLKYSFFGLATCCFLLRTTLEEAQGLFLKTEETWALGQATWHGPELCDLCHTFKLYKKYVHAGKCAFLMLFSHEHL